MSGRAGLRCRAARRVLESLLLTAFALAVVGSSAASDQQAASTSSDGATAAADELTPFERKDVRAICEKIVCYCGCPHLQVSKCFCGTADKIRESVAAQLDSGMSEDEIIAAYVAEHGTYGLAAPPKEGFNWTVWAGPFVLLFLGLVAITVLARRWTGRPVTAAGPAVVLDTEVEARHREELRRALEASE